MILYLIQISLCLVLFSLAYMIFFRRDTFFERNRIYLVGSLLISFILPFLPMPELFSILKAGGTPRVEVGVPVPVTDLYSLMAGRITISQTQTFNLFNLLAMIYISGVFVLVLQMLVEFLKIRKMMRNATSFMHGDIRIFQCEGLTSHFSFFRNIFLNKEFVEGKDKEYYQVLSHELVHVRQGHSYDLLLSQIVCITQWFNPFAWIYRRSLQEVHEFLADNKVLQSGCSRAEYLAVLVNQALGITVFSLSNNFNHIKLKKRIIMMSKMKSSNLVYWKTLIILPVIMLALSLSGSRASSGVGSGKDVSYTGKVIDSKTNMGLPGAAVIIKGTTVGTITDPNGAFKIVAPEGSTLVVSFMGYETVFYAPDKPETIVKMVKKITEIEGGTVTPASSVNATIPENVLVIVDGKEVASDYLKTADPNSIESIKVMKDEAAVKLYGEKGKNGVLIITSKKPGQLNTKGSDIGIPPPPPPPPPDSVKSGEPVYFVVEQNPEFQGGDLKKFSEYVMSNVKYPEEAVKHNIQGKVIVQFVVNHSGDVTDVLAIRSASPTLSEAAVAAVKSSPRWKPGVQSGKQVNVQFTIPINFALGDKKKDENKK